MENSITPGSTFEVAYPFVRCEVEVMTDDGLNTIQSWKPGHQEDEYGEPFAHGEGKMILDVVDVFQPGLRTDIPGYPHKKYPKRVFYLRRFVTPDGVEFGKTGLRIATEAVFKRIAGGYMHEYEVA
ncbi:hypothetical protein [Pusillimonas noertemannii]|uniref:Uncharacterized protein n=1 Tax=Pusillimonas noertemannii TaxID=305977 RepID=A0A2U1CMM1_9BURK|nr:hypothetical protein [Pusillimonas noertemannii]NYT68741.1 hypothetical protein [Pusillimonas noertemannii]PVY62239.1 hypothetical protein C7440_1732 [Pusillimonas noertemannii]TFL10782.1 hypothetical protein CSC72_09710 [Pusillimonas noertemannii]